VCLVIVIQSFTVNHKMVSIHGLEDLNSYLCLEINLIILHNDMIVRVSIHGLEGLNSSLCLEINLIILHIDMILLK
jgi:hypothetical protein